MKRRQWISLHNRVNGLSDEVGECSVQKRSKMLSWRSTIWQDQLGNIGSWVWQRGLRSQGPKWTGDLPASAEDAGDMCSIPGSGRSPGGRNGDLPQYSCLENPMDRGAWWATVHWVLGSDTTTEQLSTHTQTHTDTHTVAPICSLLIYYLHKFFSIQRSLKQHLVFGMWSFMASRTRERW